MLQCHAEGLRRKGKTTQSALLVALVFLTNIFFMIIIFYMAAISPVCARIRSGISTIYCKKLLNQNVFFSQLYENEFICHIFD